jgi:acetyl esterase/lipase
VAEDRSVLTRPAPLPAATPHYGADPDQVIDCYPATGSGLPAVVLIHGGYWRPEYDRTHARSAAFALAAAGYPTALIEYRRTPGDPDAMVDDVAAAIRAVARGATPLPAGPVLLVGHSAGGHLALLVAGEPDVRGCLALAPVADLRLADELQLDDDAVGAFLGATAAERPDLDPSLSVPARYPIVVLHGDCDELVPPALSESFTRHAGADLSLLEGVGHFGLIDPTSAAWPAVIAELRGIAAAAGIE